MLRLRVLEILAASLLTACGPRVDPANTPAIIASGTGQISLQPTVARVTVEVQTHAATAALASRQNTVRASGLLAALRGGGRVDSLRVVYVDVSPNENDAGKLVDFSAETRVEFLFRQLDSVGTILDDAVRAGATSIGQVTFESDSIASAHRQALAQAFQVARQDAQALARGSGHDLGMLLALSADGVSWTGSATAFEDASITTGRAAERFGNATSGIVSIGPTPSNIVIRATATGRWQLLPRRD